MRFLNSALFAAALYGSFAIALFLCVLLFPAPRLWSVRVAQTWARLAIRMMPATPGIVCEFRGVENIPDGPLLVVSKHQSLWETFALITFFSDPAFVLKRELMYIPIFGWWMSKLRMIPVDRGARAQALIKMTTYARKELAAGRQIIIFPEGTRRTPGEKPAYKYGATYLYSQLNVPCLPVALNSGLFWPRRTLLKHPGRIVMEFLEPIPPGLDREQFSKTLQDRIETASDRLLAEAARAPEPPPLPPAAQERLVELAD